MTTWPKGAKSELARKANITPQFLSDILAGRKKCPARLALRLAERSKKVVEGGIPVEDWILNDTTENPLFHNQKEGAREP